MELTYQGSVNRWECDENDHLNVRFYMEKHWQTLIGGNAQPLTPPLTETLHTCVRVQHVRFLRESRIAAPLCGYFGVVDSGDGWVDLLTELQHAATGEVTSSCVHRIVSAALSTSVAGVSRHKLPEHAGPRGVADDDLPYTALPLAKVAAYGFKQIGAGVIQPAEVAADEHLCMHHYMGRLSDAMPHLWGALYSRDGTLADNEGGAVLEYRLRYHQPLCAGDAYQIHSGLAAGGPRIQRFAHLCFKSSGDNPLAFSAEAVGVRMDLTARKSIVLPAAVQENMRRQQLLPL